MFYNKKGTVAIILETTLSLTYPNLTHYSQYSLTKWEQQQQAKNSRNTAATTARHFAWECAPPGNCHKPPVSVRTHPLSYQWQREIAVRASRAAAPRHDWNRPTRRLPSGRLVTADIRVTRMERVHHCDGPPTRRRISQSQQAMRLLPTWLARLRSCSC